MTKKEQIIELLDKYGNETDLFKAFITKDEFSNLADGLVKLFAIPDVSNQRELLIAFCEWCNKNNHYDFIYTKIVDDFLKGN